MKSGWSKWVPAVFGLVIAAATIPGAGAQCGASLKSVKPMSWRANGAGHAGLKTAALEMVAEDAAPAPSIVGMWHVLFTAETSNGTAIPKTVIDNAVVVWHSDQTEIMNSARPPQDGDFCLGVWQQTGPLSYALNHFAWAANNYTPGTPEGVIGAPVGGVHITQAVTLGPGGRHFSGTFKLEQFDTSGNVTQTFTGVLKATRITMDTTINDLL